MCDTRPSALRSFRLLLHYNCFLHCGCFHKLDDSEARDLLLFARSRGKPTFDICGNCSNVTGPFVLDDAVWGFSLETLKTHVMCASFMDCLRESIDLVFVNAISLPMHPHQDLRRLGTWEALLTHFVFVINTNLSGQLEVTSNRISYCLPIFNKGGNEHTLELFIHEDTEACCPWGNHGSKGQSVRWDLICTITRRQRPKQNLGSVLYAASWSNDQIVDACMLLMDEQNPIVAFLSLAYTFLSMGTPNDTNNPI